MKNKPLESTDIKSLEEILRADALLKRLPLESIESVLGHVPSPDRLEENMKRNGGKLKRQLVGRGKPAETKAQRKARLLRDRQRRARYARETAKPRRTAWSLAQIKEHGAAGWWEVLRRKGAGTWEIKKHWRIGKEEFVEALGNRLDNAIPVVFRYDTRRMSTLDNIWIVDSDTREVLFDGKEHALKVLGYCL